MRSGQWEDARERAERELAYLVDGVNSAEQRYDRASEAGAELAAEVYRFIEDPDGVGTDALREAYGTYMSLHAGNFAPIMPVG